MLGFVRNAARQIVMALAAVITVVSIAKNIQFPSSRGGRSMKRSKEERNKHPFEEWTPEERAEYMRHYSIWKMLCKNYEIPEEWIDEEPNRWKRKFYRKHNKEVRAGRRTPHCTN